MKAMPASTPMFIEEAPHKLEVNANHAIIKGLKMAIDSNQTDIATDITRQVCLDGYGWNLME
jgi:hypothetical protein